MLRPAMSNAIKYTLLRKLSSASRLRLGFLLLFLFLLGFLLLLLILLLILALQTLDLFFCLRDWLEKSL